MISRTILALFSCILISSATQAQTGTLLGTIQDEHGSAIRGATIRILDLLPARGAISRADGSYNITGLRAGIYTVSITAVGYKKSTRRGIRISYDQPTTLTVHLTGSPGLRSGDSIIVASLAVHSTENNSTSDDNLLQSARTNIQGAVALQPSAPENGITPFHIRGGRSGSTEIRVNGALESGPPTNILSTAREGDRGLADENTFIRTADERLSTFGIDVDAASYGIVRHYLTSDRMPPTDMVRIEEMLNYFTYDYPDPGENIPFSITTEIARCPWNPANKLVHIGLQGKRIPTSDLPPSNLVFLIDVSGSMGSPERLPLLQKGLGFLVDNLRPQDRVAIVTYAGSAQLVLVSTSGAEKAAVKQALQSLSAGGSTAGSEGILLAYKIAGENFLKDGNNRVILATDGDFNVGISSIQDLEALISAKRNEGVFLTVLGVGRESYHDRRMETLADKGNGNYTYLDRPDEARRAMVEQMGATLFTLAKDVKIQVEFNPQMVRSYRLIGYENRRLKPQEFHDDSKDAGELGAGHSVTALYEVEPVSMDALPLVPEHEAPRPHPESGKRPGLSHEISGNHWTRLASSGADTLLYIKIRYKNPADSVSRILIGPLLDENRELSSASGTLKFSAAVAQFGMLLRNSRHAGSATYDSVIELARESSTHDPDGLKAEFISLVQHCRMLMDAAR